ncbi:MAG: hypothetical protein HC798_01260 [Polaribacter sp.]|nr:hypothetical protein [Polaribacter sp.]
MYLIVFKNDDTNAVNSFEAMYFKTNHTVPSYYATKGFDITYDILIRLASGNSLEKTFEKGKSYRAETFFNYTNNRVSENIGLFILGYKSDLTLERLK